MKSLITASLVCLAINSFSQVSHSISLGPELGFPSKNFGEAKTAIGGGLDYRLKFKAPIALQAHVGYINFSALREQFSDYRISFIPVRVGVVGFINREKLFAFAEGGISKCHAGNVKNQTGFSFAMGLGYDYTTVKNQFIQLSGAVNLHHYKNEQYAEDYYYGWFIIRLAYGLKWGEKSKI